MADEPLDGDNWKSLLVIFLGSIVAAIVLYALNKLIMPMISGTPSTVPTTGAGA